MNRTAKQNSSMWLWAEMLADQFNKENLTVQLVLAHAVERMWDKEAVISLLFKPILEQVTGDKSTSKADTKDIIKTADILADHLAIKMGVNVPWPDRLTQEAEMRVNR